MARKGNKRRFCTFSLLAWGITPFLLLACSSGKFVQNNSRQDSVEVRKDTVGEDHRGNTREWVRDTVIVHDSVAVYQRGDTVRVDRWHTKYVTKTRTVEKTDTVTKWRTRYITKTVTKTAEKTVEREKPASLWQRVKDYWAIISVLIILGVYLLRRRHVD